MILNLSVVVHYNRIRDLKQAEHNITAASHSQQISMASLSFFYDHFTMSLSDDAPLIPAPPHPPPPLLKAALI